MALTFYLNIFQEGLNRLLEINNFLIGPDTEDPEIYQIIIRCIIIYTVGLLLIRSGAKRFLGKNTAFDVILGIIFGSVVSRAINGNAPFWGTLVAGATLVMLHWLLGYLAFKLGDFGSFVKGKRRILVKDGEIQWDEMKNSSISKKDLMRALRSNASINDVSQVKLATLERSGEISVIKDDKSPKVVEVNVKEGVQTIKIELN